MNSFYTAIIVNVVVSMMILTTIAVTNKSLSGRPKSRKGLIIAFSFITLGATSEWLNISIRENELAKLIWLVDWLRLIKFIIMPITPIITADALFEKESKNKVIEEIWFLEKIYLVIGIFLIIEGYVFFSNESSIYYSKKAWYETMMYNVYIVAFLIATMYLFANAYSFSKKHQQKSLIILLEMILFVAIGVVMQISNLHQKTSWLTISITSMFFYMYYNELIQNIDGMTGLLNQKSFHSYIESEANENKKCIIVIMDVNDFKYINDNYGHHFGDEILKDISCILKESYQDVGFCYRMGGDEFAVIVKKDFEEIEQINQGFINNLQKKREVKAELPHVSWGYSVYDPKNKREHSLQDTKKEADVKMYLEKKKFKEKNTPKMM